MKRKRGEISSKVKICSKTRTSFCKKENAGLLLCTYQFDTFQVGLESGPHFFIYCWVCCQLPAPLQKTARAKTSRGESLEMEEVGVKLKQSHKDFTGPRRRIQKPFQGSAGNQTVSIKHIRPGARNTNTGPLQTESGAPHPKRGSTAGDEHFPASLSAISLGSAIKNSSCEFFTRRSSRPAPSRGEVCGQCLQPLSQPRGHCLPGASAGTQRLRQRCLKPHWTGGRGRVKCICCFICSSGAALML